MFYAFFGVFLFGLTHPLGALLINKQSDTLIFSFFYILTRTLIQAPTFFMSFKNNPLNISFKLLLGLGVSGLIGTFLHWSEFKSLTTSLPVSHITFITFCFPIWILLYEIFRPESDRLKLVFQISLGLIGLSQIVLLKDVGTLSFEYLYPLLSSFLLGAWIINSKQVQKHKITPLQYSFLYDLFALIGIIVIISFFRKSSVIDLIYNASHFIDYKLILFSLFVGVLPNILIFSALKKIGTFSVSLIMLCEPLISSMFSVSLFNENLSIRFFIGALLILFINMPDEIFNRIPLLKFKVRKYVSNTAE